MRCSSLCAPILIATLALSGCASTPASQEDTAPSEDEATNPSPSQETTSEELPTPKTLSIAETRAAVTERDGDFTVVRLIQRSCRFVEAEPEASFEASTADQCKQLNQKTQAEREQVRLRIPAGKVRFVVSSRDVPYELGFWLRPASKPQEAVVQGGGILPEIERSYETELEPGTYVYSCPLNPTPDYLIEVQ